MRRRQVLFSAGSMALLVLLERPSRAAGDSVGSALERLKSELKAISQRYELAEGIPAPSDPDTIKKLEEGARLIEERQRQLKAAVQKAPAKDVARTLHPDYEPMKRLVPSKGPFPASPPANISQAALASQPAPPEDSLWRVLADIVIQTMGLEDFSDIVISLLQNYEPVRAVYDEAILAYREGAYFTAASRLARLPLELVGAGAEQFIEEKLGKKGAREVVQRMFNAMLLRGIPGLGQAATTILFVIALRRNWDRLQKALQKQSP